jgi:hypothetical protein
MMRKLTLTLLMMVILGSLSFGQYTASLQNVTASPNENVSVNLDVTNFTNIGSFQFYIQVNPSVLTFQNITNFPLGNLTVGSSGGNTVTIIWTSTTAHTWPNGTLLTLNFKYNGLTSPIAFIPSYCEVAKLVGGIPTILTGTFTDGSVNPFMGNAAHADIDEVSASLGTVVVPVKYTGFASNVASLTQKISYDPAKLTYISTSGTGNLATGVIANVLNGVITLTWTSAAGQDINYPASQINLNFSYLSLVTTPVNFSTGCIITTPTPVTNIPVTYLNGSVTPAPPITSFASLPAITTAVQGQFVDVPLTFTSMPDGTNNFNVNLTYDNPRMSFIGILNPPSTITSNVSGNTISLLYTNTTVPAPSINGEFLVIRFLYNGVGTANINFANGCQFSNGSPIGVGYTNGSVTPALAAVNANIGTVNAASGSQVAIPVTFTGIPSGTNIGALTMNIGFDATKPTYVNALNPNNANVQLVGSVLNIAWSNPAQPIENNSTFITLYFNYAASGNTTTSIIFKDGCQAAITPSGAIVPANWNNGGVNIAVPHSISGYLKYDNSPAVNMPIAGATIYVKDGPEPVPPAVGPIPNIIATTTTGADGSYTVNVLDGSYYIYASNTATWAGGDQGDVINLRRYIANLSPNTIVGNALRVRASDINQDGSVENGDVIPLRRRIANLTPNPNFLAPDWLFWNPSVVVNSANLIGIDLLGICSGDVNGSYPN